MRQLIYCIVPWDLSSRLHEPLRQHFLEDSGVEVVVERRTQDRRAAARRRDSHATESERRQVRNEDGRRVGDRRAMEVAIDAPVLPRRFRRYADRIVFVQRLAPSDRHEESLDTNRLIIRFQRGDRDAISELYLRYFNRVYAYVRLALRDAHEAEDVAQEVFMRVIGALDRFEIRRDESFSNWLMRIARNLALTSMTQRGRLTVEDPARLSERQAALPELEAQAFEWISDDELMMFVERLPLVQRQVLFLSYMLALNSEEIAAVLDMTPDAVRKARSRATRMLGERLAILTRAQSSRPVRDPMRVVLRHARVLRARRFALGAGGHVRA
jgi:RNA polymerase sigma-70 factor (ECF subfamily)